MINEDSLITNKRVDFNMLFLYQSLSNFNYMSLPKDIKRKLNELKEDIAKITFDIIPNGYDIVEEKHYIVTTYKH